jgi:hypothetical protein
MSVAARLGGGCGARPGEKMYVGLQPSNQIANRDLQSVGDNLQRIERHALEPILQPVEVHSIQTGKFGKLILGYSLLDPNCPDSLANGSIDVLQQSRLWC